MKRSTTTTLLFSMLLLMLWSCSKKEAAATTAIPNLPATPYDYSTSATDRVASVSWSDGRVTVDPPKTHHSSDHGATLGRVIFHDFTISSGNSCNGCHNPTVAGHSGTDLFVRDYTGSSATQLPAVHPAVGMEDAGALIVKMSATSYYQQLFRDAYGTPEITTERISDALAQYMTAMAAHARQESLVADPRFSDPFK